MDIKCSDVAECSWVLNNWGCHAPVNRGGEHSFTWSSLGRWELSKFTLGRLVGFQTNYSPENCTNKESTSMHWSGLSLHRAAQLYSAGPGSPQGRKGGAEVPTHKCQHSTSNSASPESPRAPGGAHKGLGMFSCLGLVLELSSSA